MEVPKWMTKELFEDSLRSFYNNRLLKVLGYSCKPAVSTGENYTSDVARVTVTYSKGINGKKEVQSIIVKYFHYGGFLEDFAKTVHLFDKEIEMFSKTLPKMYKILGRHGEFSSNCFKASTDPLPILLLEDITQVGYQVHNRQCGLDMDHCLLVIKKMAAFHATSVVMCDEDPSVINKLYAEGLYPNHDMILDWMKLGFNCLKEALGRWPGFEKYQEKLKVLGDKALARSHASWQKKPGGFNVLNHGDLWVNNFMFSYDNNGKVQDLKFIDYQLVVYSSPAVDLHYFLSTSARDDVRAEHLNFLLDYYYANLLATLAHLRYSLERVPSRDDFRRDFKARAFYGLNAAVTVTPLVKASSRKDATFDDLLNDESKEGFRYHCYNNSAYKSAMTQLVPYFDSLGILD